MVTITPNTALIIIDVQDGFDDPVWGARNNPEAEANIARLLAAWRAARRPLFYIQHLSQRPTSPLYPESPGNAIKSIVQPLGDEPVITKRVHSAFIGTDLEPRLRDQEITQVVIVGLTTMHCVSTTTRMAGDLGFETIVVADATAAFDSTGHDGRHFPAQLVHDVALAELHGEFATVLSTDHVLAQAE